MRSLTVLLCAAMTASVWSPTAADPVTPDCVALAAYRDKTLVHDYDVAAVKYRLSVEAKADLAKYRAQLGDISFWHTSDFGKAKDAIVSVMDATDTLIINLLKLNPETFKAAEAADSAKTTVLFIVNGVQSGATISSLVGTLFQNVDEQKAEGQSTYEQLKLGASAIKDLSKQVKALSEMNEQADALQKTISMQMANLDAQTAQYDGTIKSALADIAAINTVQTAIAQVCSSVYGTWRSNDAARRFGLAVMGDTVVWTERNKDTGAILTRTVNVTKSGTDFRIERPNDDAVLAFLGYQPSLRQEIQTRSPRPSYMILTRGPSGVHAQWYGLLVTKDSNAHLKQLFQPGDRPPTPFEFAAP